MQDLKLDTCVNQSINQSTKNVELMALLVFLMLWFVAAFCIRVVGVFLLLACRRGICFFFFFCNNHRVFGDCSLGGFLILVAIVVVIPWEFVTVR